MAKNKTKTAYVCKECGAEHMKWQGQCATCGVWNSLGRVSIGPIAEAGHNIGNHGFHHVH